MADPSDTRRAGDARPPNSTAEALERAARHARSAAAELAAAARALLDAAALGMSGRPAEAHEGLAGLARGIDLLAERWAAGRGSLPGPMIDSILRALDVEIERWEKQSADDAEARAVLRTFLGLREILWEFGLRPGGADSEETRSGGAGRSGSARARAKSTRSETKNSPAGTKRIQRVEVRG